MNNEQHKQLRQFGMYRFTLLEFMSLLAILGAALAVVIH
jgi:hypothetical protein